MVLELMSWGSLEALIEAQWNEDPGKYAMDEEVLAVVMHSILSALEYLHDDAGLIHADIKPSNCLLSRHGEVKLSDFGICRSVQGALRSGGFSGTMGYMSPERLNGQGLSVSADVWSLGVVAVEYATGRHPYAPSPPHRPTPDPASSPRPAPGPAASVIDVMQRVLHDPAPDCPARVSPGLAGLIRSCLAKDPACRTSAASLLALPPLAGLSRLPEDARLAPVAGWLRRMPPPHAQA
jgi:serine/threonine protein kinase